MPNTVSLRQVPDRQKQKTTYAYLLASRHDGEALIIDPVLEKVDR